MTTRREFLKTSVAAAVAGGPRAVRGPCAGGGDERGHPDRRPVRRPAHLRPAPRGQSSRPGNDPGHPRHAVRGRRERSSHSGAGRVLGVEGRPHRRAHHAHGGEVSRRHGLRCRSGPLQPGADPQPRHRLHSRRGDQRARHRGGARREDGQAPPEAAVRGVPVSAGRRRGLRRVADRARALGQGVWPSSGGHRPVQGRRVPQGRPLGAGTQRGLLECGASRISTVSCSGPSPSTAPASPSFVRGGVQLAEALPLQDIQRLREGDEIVVSEKVGFRWEWFGFNVREEYAGRSRKLRQAFQWAIDREALHHVGYFGTGSIGYDGILPGSPFHDPDYRPYERDLDKARRLVEESGLDQPIELLGPDHARSGQAAHHADLPGERGRDRRDGEHRRHRRGRLLGRHAQGHHAARAGGLVGLSAGPGPVPLHHAPFDRQAGQAHGVWQSEDGRADGHAALGPGSRRAAPPVPADLGPD